MGYPLIRNTMTFLVDRVQLGVLVVVEDDLLLHVSTVDHLLPASLVSIPTLLNANTLWTRLCQPFNCNGQTIAKKQSEPNCLDSI